MFSQLFYDLLASGEWWDTILADFDRSSGGGVGAVTESRSARFSLA